VIAYTASYYGISPLEVEGWRTSQVNEYYEEAIKIENAKAKAYKAAQENG
jgi:hypothetical protein